MSKKARPRWLNCIKNGDVDRVSLHIAVGVVASHVTGRASEHLLRSTIARGQEDLNRLFETTTVVQSIALSSRAYCGAASGFPYFQRYEPDASERAFLRDILQNTFEWIPSVFSETIRYIPVLR